MSREKYIGMDVHQATISVAAGMHRLSRAPESQRFCVYPAVGGPRLRANDAHFARSHFQKRSQQLALRTKGQRSELLN
jgi:hypothetical protein